MMLARIRLQPSPSEPAISALDGALIPLAIAQKFADAIAANLPDGEVWLIKLRPELAALLYPTPTPRRASPTAPCPLRRLEPPPTTRAPSVAALRTPRS